MRKLSNCILFAMFVLILLPSYPIAADLAPRGIQTISIKDHKGNEIGIFNESHALIIGAVNYTNGWPSLPGVEADVSAVSKALKDNGFSIETVIDPDRATLIKAFEDFIEKYGYSENSRLIFYFAGHGHTVKKGYGSDMGYIVPVEAPNPNTDLNGFKQIAINMQQIEVYAKDIESKHVLFLFDSCFSGSIFSLSRAVPANISYKTTMPVRQFITSGSANETVPDESQFRKQFVSALKGAGDVDKDGYVTGSELGEYLQKNVVNYTEGGQHPQYGKIRNPKLDRGDFVFLLNAGNGADEVDKAAGNNHTLRGTSDFQKEMIKNQQKLFDEIKRLKKEVEELKKGRGK